MVVVVSHVFTGECVFLIISVVLLFLFFSCSVGIARFHSSQLFTVVNDNTSNCWLALGLEMGLKYDQVMSTVEGTYAYKKENAVKLENTEQLLTW